MWFSLYICEWAEILFGYFSIFYSKLSVWDMFDFCGRTLLLKSEKLESFFVVLYRPYILCDTQKDLNHRGPIGYNLNFLSCGTGLSSDHLHIWRISVWENNSFWWTNKENKQTPWSDSSSELYRPSDRHLLTKWLPTFVDRRCHVVSVTDPYGRRQEPLLFNQVAPQLYSRGWVEPVPDPLLFFLVVPEIEPGPPDL
jgi:hypothetical protein